MIPPIENADRGIRITASTIVSCLGHGRSPHIEALRSGRSGLAPADMPGLPFECFIGSVAGLDSLAFPKTLADCDNRASRLTLAALAADGFDRAVAGMRERWGPARCGVVIGTSTSGIEKLEQVYREREESEALPTSYSMRRNDNHQAVGAFLQDLLDLRGPSYAVSTACSSSSKALIDAVQLIEAGVCDAVLTGGVDCLCLTSLNGFEALQLVSPRPCRPCDAERDGISIGEAAALMIVERDADTGFRLVGAGETSDGHNMSTPPEDGAGAAAAMRATLDAAGLTPADIGYVNLHGTATRTNDAAEARAVLSVLGPDVPASSLKGAIGHTLGAAGAAEIVLCLYALEEGVIPGNTGLHRLDPEIAVDVKAESRSAELKYVLSNAFGFGGNNCVVALGR
ncbi:MAG: beta-ketoacyl-ACP synthase [Pseudomonadota bacterium]